MKLELTALALAALAPPAASAADAPEAQAGRCDRSTVGSSVIAMRTARALLLAVPPVDDGTSVPPATGRRIEALKDRLRDFVRTMMDCAPTAVEPAALTAAMAQRGGISEGTTGDAVPPPPDRNGSLVAFEVSRVEAHPDMLAVVATVAIKCGSDSMLMLYRRQGGRWSEVMVRRSEPYSEVKGGWGDLRFAVSPTDPAGGWFVATVSTTPWCTSAWQGMPYELARPGAAPDRPKVIFRGRNTIYLGDESDLLLKAERDAFELRNDGSSLDPEILIRRHVRRYSVAGDSVRRVQPVAESVRDFADEWIDSPWSEAKDWSAPGRATAAAHSALQAARWKTLGGFASIRACTGGATQIEIAGEGAPGWFLVVRGGAAGPWTLERVERRAVAGCGGPDRLGRD
ncbi:MAG: hypothetical protein QOJ91_1512 [Sphingomonadales bacterium]|jgi:hypothetical protein|nr:hypothetical protein [Sphingomonadales bacterium]